MAATKSFFVTKNLPEKFFKAAKYLMEMWPHPQDITRPQLLERVKGKSGILCTLSDRIDRQVLDAAGPQLKVVSTLSVGYDHIDIEECHRRGIAVGNTPDVLTDTVAELTIALMLATIRRLFEANKALREGRWPPGWGHFFMTGSTVKDSVIGVVGGGRIGQSILVRLRAFQPSKMLYQKRNRSTELEQSTGAEFCPNLADLLQQSDIVLICCSLNETTKHLIGSEQFKLMKSTAVIINTSRGAVIDQKALYQALKSKQISAAGLDVYETEPLPLDDPLLTLDNVVLLPHIGSAGQKTREEMISMAMQNLEAGIEDRPLVAAVVPK